MSYSMISSPELTAIAKLPKSAILTYLALCQHTYGRKTTCFPSIRRLIVVLQGAVCERSIYRALAALEAAGIIKRNKKTSKSRFHLRVRQMFMDLTETSEKPDTPVGVREKVKNHFSKRKYKKNKNLSFQRSQAEQPATPKPTMTQRPTPPPEDCREVAEIKEILRENVYVAGMDERLLSAFTEQRDWDWLKRMKPKYWDYLRTKRSKR